MQINDEAGLVTRVSFCDVCFQFKAFANLEIIGSVP